MWVWQSFGFRTAVEKAAEFINNLNWEAEATRRVCLIELFGAESGFVAANAALASSHVDLVLVPEEFQALKPEYYKFALDEYITYLIDKVAKMGTVNEDEKPHAVVVLAEGVAKILSKEKITLGDQLVDKSHFTEQLRAYLEHKIFEKGGRDVDVFANQPRHNIRAIKANAQDQIYCERLGALAVDNALAGYTDFMISQWLTEYVLVPLELVQDQNKRIPPQGIFWKQVVSSTGQPTVCNEKYEKRAC
ncbi:MAG: 6-phosphofructokinase, partial [Pyrinomonadaceae bacterium]